MLANMTIGRRVLRLAIGVVVGSGIAIGCVWLLSIVLADPETLYRGKPLEYWVEQATNQDTSARDLAMAAVTNEIIPQLTQVMFHDTNEAMVKLAVVEKLNELPKVAIASTPAADRRAKAALAIGEFGPAAKPAIPALIQAVKSSDEAVHESAVTALGKIHGEPETVIPLLIGCLDDKEIYTEASRALGNFGSLAEAAVPKLIPLLEIPDKDLRAAVSRALRKIDNAAADRAGVKGGYPN